MAFGRSGSAVFLVPIVWGWKIPIKRVVVVSRKREKSRETKRLPAFLPSRAAVTPARSGRLHPKGAWHLTTGVGLASYNFCQATGT